MTIDITNEIFQAALDSAQIGLPVFPCRIRDEGHRKAKSPYNEHGFKEATTDPVQIKRWWTNFPDAIIGMPTGNVSGLVVVDIDPRHGGDYSLQGLEEKYGNLPGTLTAITGGGGTHYYFRHPGKEIRCSTGKIASGIDIKADGGYVILPPSGHESGGSYFWDGDFDLNAVAKIPEWLLNLIENPQQQNSPAIFANGNDIPEGKRNNTLAKLGGKLRQIGMGYSEILAAMQATNQERCKPPLPESETEAIVKSICRYEPDQAAVIAIEGISGIDLSGITKNEKTNPIPQLVTVTLSDVQAKELQWLWPNRLPAGMLSLLVGNPGVGKSFLMMYLCSQITTGRDWPDAENNIPQGSVLLFSDEESLEYAIKPRLEAHDADCTKILAVKHIERPDGLPDTFGINEHIQLLRAYLNGLPDCRLIIFDPITAYLGAVKANDNAEVRGALLGLQNLAQEKNITILGINHFSKKAELDSIHRVLGSTGFVAAARAVWGVVLEKQDEESSQSPMRLLSPIKSNYSIDPTTLRYSIIDGRVIFEDEESRTDIDAIMQKAKKNNPNLETAKDFLKQELKGRAFEYSKDILEKAKEAGISKNLIYKAKGQMKILDWREGFGMPVRWSLEPNNN